MEGDNHTKQLNPAILRKWARPAFPFFIERLFSSNQSVIDDQAQSHERVHRRYSTKSPHAKIP